jgi:hypothetical protein
MSSNVSSRHGRICPALCSTVALALLACATPKPVPAPAAPIVTPAPLPSSPAPRPVFENRGGMWMPSQMPAHAELLKSLGLAIDPALLSDPKSSVLGAIVNLNGCSASFVSKDGLVATNHHCATAALQRNSTPQANLLETGFLAKSRAEERPSGPASRLSVLSAMKDVTDKVRPVLLAIQDDLARKHELDRLEKETVASCELGRPGVRCGFVSLYGGLRYFSIETLEIRDIRIVYAPPEGIGNFGGEIDNWRWPRHTGDVALFRAYVGPDGLPADYSERNVPHHPPAHLKLASAPLAAGDLVFVAGYPAQTSLLAPAVEMREVTEQIYPQRLAMFDAYLGLIEGLAKADPEVAIKGARWIRGFSNYRTKHKGELEGFARSSLASRKLDEEKALSAFIAADPRRQAAYGSLLSDLETAYREAAQTREADTALEREILMPRLLFAAYRIARMADERQKPDAAREPSYQERNVPKLRDELKALGAQIHPQLDRAILKLALQRDRARSPERRTPALALIAGADPTDAAIDRALARLYDKTRLADEAFRTQLFDTAQPQTLEQNPDPIVRLVAKLYPALRAVESRRKRFQGKMLIQMPRYLEMLLAFRGTAVAPDANGTLRLAYGTVQGAPAGSPGADIGAFTRLSEVVAKHTGKEPFDAPDSLLLAAKNAGSSRYADKALGDVPVDFMSDLHITNGNSGSATLNGRGELVGLAFDGTYESVASDWVYLPSTRSIHVDLRYMLFLLDEVERASPALLGELGVAPRSP